VLPPPLTSATPAPLQRERIAVAYTPDVKAKGLDVVCAAWAAAGLEDAQLEVFGVERQAAVAHLQRTSTPLAGNVAFHGKAPPDRFRAALRRARAYVGGARWEDFGQAPLEALADGALLATVPSSGPFEALALARELAPELVTANVDAAELAAAIKAAFELPEDRLRAYRERATALLDRFRPEAIQRTVAEQVIPRLLG
jgi:glycosyltransferase involved in cell wall biosynthesis